MAGKLADAGTMEFAGQFLRQAEEAYTWANALKAGAFVEVGEDMVGVNIDTLDAWVPCERVAILNARVRGESLPLSPSDVSRETYSPQNVSRETSSCTMQVNAALTPPPSAPAPSAYDGVMETYTSPVTTASDLVAQLISLIVKQVMAEVSVEIESAVESAFDDKDIVDDVTESYSFAQAVENAVDNLDLTDKVREALGEMTFSVSVD
jgi:hypothetical protein